MAIQCRIILAFATFAVAQTKGHAQESGVEFFENKIRPVLVEHCYKCHSRQAGKERGGLRLDTRDALRRGGDNGPAIVPGKPRDSLLFQSMEHTKAELKMPRNAPKLPAQVRADFARWIEIGAPDPRDDKTVGSPLDFDAAKKHWAYQPIRKPPAPTVKDRAWLKMPLDSFILVKLEEKGLTPSPQADARTLIRRLYFDLIGLPPTPEDVDRFAKAMSEKGNAALAALVDELLASPQYGERWARHWLDVARYADTKDGVLMYGDDRIRPYAYTYRDYVIRAFNDDTPFDRFIHEQLAADAIEPKIEPWRLAAMGFLTLGRQYDNNIHDVIDDRIDTVTRGFLGLTVACARCHDHKYDAIPTADYYSLYGVFANSQAPLEPPLAEQPERCETLPEYEKAAGPHREKMQKMLDSQYALLIDIAQKRVGDYLVRAATTEPDLAETAIYFLSLAPTDLRPPLVNAWRKYLEHPARAHDPVFGPWPELMNCNGATYAKDAAAVVERWQTKLNPLVRDVLTGTKLSSKADVANAYGTLLRGAIEQSKGKTPTAEQLPLVNLVASKQSPGYFPKAHTWLYMSRSEKDAYGGMRTQFDKIALKMKAAPPRAMVLLDAEDLVEPRIFVRGSAAAPGEQVPRQFLRVLAGAKRQPFTHGSGRLDLAKAIASRDNPLTARVLVNRVWMHHFGEPLVATPSDFGVRSTPPSHPELLDFLAASFMDDGWSLKKLHRQIVLSATYLQASFDRPEMRKLDPENRHYWRANRRRLDLESMRDGYLRIAGRLDATMLGRPVDIVNDPKNARRTVYGLVDRQSLPGLFRVFDFAVPDQSVERRPMTTVPQQALFGLNSPFMLEQAKSLAARADTLKGEERVQQLYRLVFARAPTSPEVKTALRFVAATPSAKGNVDAWQQYAQVLLLTNEALFVD